MAQSASSCGSSQSRPLFSASSSDSNPASPRTPFICKEGRLDSTAEDCCCATSPPLSPYAAAAAAEEEERLSRDYDAARSLIERLDDGWFRGNVVTCRWGHSSPPSAEVVDGFGAATRDRLVEDSASSQGIRAPDATGLSATQRDLIKPPPLRSIEMVAPLVTSRSYSGERDTKESRDLPRMRMRQLPKRPGSMDDADTCFSDPDQKQVHRASMNDALHRFGEMRIEPSRFGPVVRSKKPEDVVVLSRPFSDGDERSEDLKAPLPNVYEEGESASEDKPPTKVSRKLSLPVKLGPIEPERELRNPLTDRNITKALPLRARRSRERKRRSKSSTDVEFDEMRGWMDLGFKINEDDLTPRPVPGRKDGFKGGDDLFDSPRGLGSPQGWPKRPDSPLFKWPIPAANGSNDDMREHLKQWAHYVASSVVSAEC